MCDSFLMGFQYLFSPIPQEYVDKIKTVDKIYNDKLKLKEETKTKRENDKIEKEEKKKIKAEKNQKCNWKQKFNVYFR